MVLDINDRHKLDCKNNKWGHYATRVGETGGESHNEGRKATTMGHYVMGRVFCVVTVKNCAAAQLAQTEDENLEEDDKIRT